MPTLVSVYDLVSDTSNVVRSLKARGFDDLTTYAPAPRRSDAPSSTPPATVDSAVSSRIGLNSSTLHVHSTLDESPSNYAALPSGGVAYSNLPAAKRNAEGITYSELPADAPKPSFF